MLPLPALFLMIAAPTSGDALIDGPPAEWLKANAPFGFDVTFDGKIWVNTNEVGKPDDYAILGNDLYKVKASTSEYPRVWIRGYHARNPKVRYRESKMLVSIDCVRDTYWVQKDIRYDARGEVVENLGPFPTEPIVPSSYAESWQKAACPEASR